MFRLNANSRLGATFFLVCQTMGLLCLLAGVVAAADFEVKSALLMDQDSGTVLYEQEPDRLIPPASLTKIMTLYLIWEDVQAGKAKLNGKIKISREAAETGGSSMNLKAGERVKLIDLIKGMAVASGNDACMAVAEHFGGEEAFVARMNKKAKALGMKHTTFKNPNGLPASGQLTTARDIMILADAYLKAFPDSLNIHSLTSFTHNKVRKRNSNRLLGVCDGVDGLKTGYVAASGFNIVATAKRDGRRLIAVVLGGKTSRVRNHETTQILELGFDKLQEPETRLAEVKTLPLRAGTYCVQESSWDSLDKAERHAASLRAKGLPVQVETADLGAKGVWHRVILGGYAQRSEAEQARRLLIKRLNRKDPFIRRVEVAAGTPAS